MLSPWMLWITVAAFLGGCAALPPLPPLTQRPSDPVAEHHAPRTIYTVGAEDVLRITVYGHPDLSLEVTVGTDGAFTYPLLGTVQTAGRTIRQLEAYLTQALSTYLVNPQVSAAITRFHSHRVQVVGEVHKPGMYMLQRPSMLVEILAEAGGPTLNAGWEVTVVRAPNNGRYAEPMQVDLEQLLAGALPPITIDSGATIYVSGAAFFYVLGEVKHNGRYRLERHTTVAKAITMAGGLTAFAAKKRLTVRRLIAGQPREFRVTMTDFLQPGDHLIVPESMF